jgi:hypothetical protein
VRERKRVMTESEWASCDNPMPILQFLRSSGRANDRKLRLFAVGCCRRTCHAMMDERSRRAVETAELYADGLASKGELSFASDPAGFLRRSNTMGGGSVQTVLGRTVREIAGYVASQDSWAAATAVARTASWVGGKNAAERVPVTRANAVKSRLEAEQAGKMSEQKLQADLLRDLFGPLPFREVPIDPVWLAWNDGVVGKLAASVYEGRAFEQMPILPDALEEAGCANEEMLTHCRQPGQPHVRGCWLLDLVRSVD